MGDKGTALRPFPAQTLFWLFPLKLDLKIGAHLSIEGGVHRAIERGVELGCKTIQLFLRNNNRWKGREFEDWEIERFKYLAKESGISPLIAHAIYLINLSSPEKNHLAKSISAVIEDLRKCLILGISYLILHPGFHIGSGEKEGIKRFAKSLKEVIGECEGVEILVENSSGGGTQIGWSIEQLKEIIERAGGELGICIDTCHLFSAGYPIHKREGFERTMDEIERKIGLEKIKVIHVNDSKRGCGSRIDRHEHIGIGRIGEDGFRFFLNFKPFRKLPFIIETPKEKGPEGIDMDILNIEKLKRLAMNKWLDE